MPQTLQCPECQVHLTLPSLGADQTVQCPRCRHVFAATPALPKRATMANDDEAFARSEPEPLSPLAPLTGEWKAAFACVTLALCAVLGGIQAWVHYEQIELTPLERKLDEAQFNGFRFGAQIGFHVEAPPNPQAKELAQRSQRRKIISDFVEPVHSFCSLAAIIAVLIWLVQACQNLRLLRADGLYFTPFSAAISFFIPIVNLLQPYQAVMEIWRASDPTAIRSSISWQASPYALPIHAWWIFCVAGILLPLLGTFGGPAEFDGGDGLHGLYLLGASCILLAIAAGTLIYIIRDITIRQRERYERLYDDAE